MIFYILKFEQLQATFYILARCIHINFLIVLSFVFIISYLRSAWVVMPTVQSARQVHYAEEDLGSRISCYFNLCDENL
jgi:hypothetical protein